MAAKKILLIDDSEFILESTAALLAFEGYDVITALNGEIGIELATKELPDLIICDVAMPGLTGYDVIKRIRSNPSTQIIPFIFLTAFADKSKMREGMEKGADDYLTKPFTKQELVASINSQLVKHANVEAKIQTKVNTVHKNLNYSMPHEFRTVVSQLMGSINVIKDCVDDLDINEIIKTVDEMIEIVERLNRVTDNFLLLTKLESFANMPDVLPQLKQMRTIEPFAVLYDVAENVGNRFRRLDDIDSINDVFDISIAVSPELFHKCMNELFDNAFKFSPQGSKVIIDSKVEDDFFYVTISDSGVGMTTEQIKAIGAFMQFQREVNEQQGIGLGLTIAKRIIEIHDGFIDIISNKNQGTTIKFALPLAKE